MHLPEERRLSAAQPVLPCPGTFSSCFAPKKCSSALKSSHYPLVHKQPPALPCPAADVGFSRLLSNTHLSMQSGAAGTYAYAGEAGLHRGLHLGCGAPVFAFFSLGIATWLACCICMSPASFEQLLVSPRDGSCSVWSLSFGMSVAG